MICHCVGDTEHRAAVPGCSRDGVVFGEVHGGERLPGTGT